MKWVNLLHCMNVVCSLNHPMITGNCDPHKISSMHERNYEESKENIKQSLNKKNQKKHPS